MEGMQTVSELTHWGDVRDASLWLETNSNPIKEAKPFHRFVYGLRDNDDHSWDDKSYIRWAIWEVQAKFNNQGEHW